ncbi:MAG: hypothetical protein LAO20_02165 [Acidobacteriia bacterium]|nr:hypothetical protein [Terriglobia bacterium]
MCFLARPADGEFQLEEDILRQLLKERNYDCYVALQRIDPGNFAFCTKICSKIITSHFTIVLLNNSVHAESPGIKIPNPNVHFEYGMMLSFHKHVIPMQRQSEKLAFNIYPLDTIKYKPENFKDKAEVAIDDAILRFKVHEPTGGQMGIPDADVVKYMGLRGLRLSDMTANDVRAVFSLGAVHQFNLFDSSDEVVFFGRFQDEKSTEIVMRVRLLLNNITEAYKKVQRTALTNPQDAAPALMILDHVRIEILVPESADLAKMAAKIEQFQSPLKRTAVFLRRPSEIEAEVKSQYKSMEL